MNRTLLLFAALLSLLAASACSGKSDEPSTAEPTPGTIAQSASASASTRPQQTANAGATIEPGATTGSLVFGGETRTYRLFVPSKLSGAAVPLFVGLHGGLGSGQQFAENSHFEQTAEQQGFIAVFPDGISRTWNGGGCCGPAATRRIDDVGFLAALIERLEATLPIDRARVFMAGHSNGGIMAFRFGCERPDLVKGVGSVAGSLETPTCTAAEGTSLIAIHGDSDQSHPIDGGQGPRSIAGVDFVSQQRSLELWTSAMGCEADPVHKTAGAITSTTWSECRDGSRTSYMVVAGADHPWPGGVGGRPDAQSRTSTALDATAAIWTFFKTLD